MKREIADRWVAELRSGKYPQGRGMLNSPGGLCCLGVLCEIAKEEIELKVEKELTGYVKYNGAEMLPPDPVVDWAGLGSRDGMFYESGAGDEEDQNNLANLNDIGKTFHDIADVIEQRWEEL